MNSDQWRNVADNLTGIACNLIGILEVQQPVKSKSSRKSGSGAAKSSPVVGVEHNTPSEIHDWLAATAANRKQLHSDTGRLIQRLQFTANLSENDVKIRDEVVRFAESAKVTADRLDEDRKFYDVASVNNARAECQMLQDHVDIVSILVETRTPKRKVSADTQKFSDAVTSVACPLTQELLWARWNGIHNGTNAAQIGSDFRKKNSKKLGKTVAERKSKWDTISKRARTVIKPFVPDE